MKNSIAIPRSIFSILKITSHACLMMALLVVFANESFAQTITGSVRGTVLTPSGEPAVGARVTVTDTRTNSTRVSTTDASGVFKVSGLAIGGPFTIGVSSDDYKGALVTDVFTNLSGASTFNIALEEGAIEEVIVTGSAVFAGVKLAIGPSANFNIAVLESAPAINRNITDVIRADARIYVDESRGDINAVQCMGKNSRFNSMTLDGVRMNDSFGLNSNGYPTERMPFSYDAINQVSVEMAPFDLQYGGFSACNINAVTKSGANEFFGSAFYDYTGDSLRGKSLEGDKIETGDYSEKRYGVTFGGPIIKDKLFFFIAYEKLDGANLFDRGPIGSGAVNEVLVTQAELDEIASIARDIYFYDPGVIPSSMDHEDEKILLKLDWDINESHRAAFTYTYNDGENFTQSDGDQSEIEFSNHLYERGAELKSYVGSLYSSWSDNFSTEFRASSLKLDNRQVSVGPVGFGEIRVELDDVDVYLGGDDSRQSNKLDYDVTTFSLKGHYDLNGHILTAGIEREELDIFNLFVQHTETEIRFDGIEDFRNGQASRVYYNNAPSHNPDDAAARWGYAISTLFLQDEFSIADRWTIVAGVRYDRYSTSDAPPTNQGFVDDYGFSNNATLDGESLFQPRLGFTYDLNDTTDIRGGIGLYGGGNPNVWLSNTYSANNVQQFGTSVRGFDLTDPTITYQDVDENAPAGAGPGWGIPSPLYDDITAGEGSNFEINYLDPNFKLPSEWKFALGLTHVFTGDYVFTADFLMTKGKDTAIVQHGDLEQVGTNPDGYPIYDSVREASFVLTNSSKGNESISIAFGLAKSFDNGFDFTAGYAYNDAKDVSPMTSSVAFSNYLNRAFFDPQEDILSTSNYNIEHRFTFTTTWRKDLLGKYPMNIALYGAHNTGRPYSITYDGTINPYGFTPYLDFRDVVLEPGDKRNSKTGSSWTKVDFRIDVGMPGFFGDDKFSVFMIIDNLGNMINDSWGVLNQHNFPRTVEEGTSESRIGDASRYEVRFGMRYVF
jgi:hypothetical protein